MSTQVAPLFAGKAAQHVFESPATSFSAMFSDSSSSGGFLIRNPLAQSATFWRLLLTGIALVMIGCYWLLTTEEVEAPDKFGVTTFYGGREPKSSWVSVNGRLLWDGAAYEGTDYFGTWYVPMVSRNWEWGDQVKLVVKVSSTTAEDWGEMEEVEGMLVKRLPDFVEKFFQNEGPQPSDNVMLLRAGDSPGDWKRFAHLVIVAGALAIGGSLLLYDPDPHDPSKRSASQAKPRLLGPRPSDLAELRGEVTPDDPRVRAREDAVRQWKREHGLKSEEPEPAEEVDSEQQLA